MTLRVKRADAQLELAQAGKPELGIAGLWTSRLVIDFNSSVQLAQLVTVIPNPGQATGARMDTVQRLRAGASLEEVPSLDFPTELFERILNCSLGLNSLEAALRALEIRDSLAPLLQLYHHSLSALVNEYRMNDAVRRHWDPLQTACKQYSF